MRSIDKLKLSQLSKDSIETRQMNQLRGGIYCYWSDENQKANENEGKCSCVCLANYVDYYGIDGISDGASTMKNV